MHAPVGASERDRTGPGRSGNGRPRPLPGVGVGGDGDAATAEDASAVKRGGSVGGRPRRDFAGSSEIRRTCRGNGKTTRIRRSRRVRGRWLLRPLTCKL